METWKPVKGWYGLYEVSNQGEICSVRVLKNGRVKKVLMKPNMARKEYLTITFTHCGKTLCTTVAKVVASAFIPNPHNRTEVGHKDGNVLNNNVENLYWAERTDIVAKIPVLNVTTGEQYKSMREATKKLNVDIQTIRRHLSLDLPMKGIKLASKTELTGTLPDLPDEKWMFIQGTNNQFKISNMGRVKSCIRNTVRCALPEMLCKVKILTGRPVVNIRVYNGKKIVRKQLSVNRVVLQHFAGIKTNTRDDVRHKNGNLLDCRLSNLEA